MSLIAQDPALNQIALAAEPHHTPEQIRIPTQIPATNSDQNQLQAQNEPLNAPIAVSLDEFFSKTRRVAVSKLENDMNCTICLEPFLRGENPEEPVSLDCGHIFDMGCILEWLFPVSCNGGKNSCPNCRKPVFDDWARRVVAGPIPPPLADPWDHRASTSGSLVMVDPVITPRHERVLTMPLTWVAPGQFDSARAQPLPAGFTRGFQYRRVDQTADTAETADATASTTSVAATTKPVAPSTPLPPPLFVSEETSHQYHAVQGLQTVATNGFCRMETARPNYMPLRGPPSRQFRIPKAGSISSRREWKDARVNRGRLPPMSPFMEQSTLAKLAPPFAQIAARRSARRSARRPTVATAATPARAEAARSTEDENDDMAAISNNAQDEHNRRQRQLAATEERKWHMWIQICEGVVRTIELSSDNTAFTNHDLALTIINMKDLDELLAARENYCPTWMRIVGTFPDLYREMVPRLEKYRPLPSVNIDSHLEFERILACDRSDAETLHRAHWHTRLSERLARGAAFSNHESAVAHLTERVASRSYERPMFGQVASETLR